MSGKKAVIGLGNPLRGDDGIGVRILQELEKRGISPDITLIDGGTGGVKLLHLLKDFDDVLIIDAIYFGAEPGTYVFFTPEEALSNQRAKSPHDTPFFDVIELSERLHERPEKIVIMGIQPQATDMGEGLSSAVRSNLADMVKAVMRQVKE